MMEIETIVSPAYTVEKVRENKANKKHFDMVVSFDGLVAS